MNTGEANAPQVDPCLRDDCECGQCASLCGCPACALDASPWDEDPRMRAGGGEVR